MCRLFVRFMGNADQENTLESLRKLVAAYRRAFSGLPREVWFLAAVVLINRCGSMVMPFLTLYVHQELHFDQVWAGMIVVAYGLGSSLGTFLGGMVAERFGAIRIQVLSLLANALGFAILSQMTSYAAFAVTLFLLSVLSDAFKPANSLAITQFAPVERHRQAFALNRLAINLGFTVGPLVGGLLASVHYQFLFWIDAITCALAGWALWYLLGRRDSVAPAVERNQTGDRSSPLADFRFLAFLGFTLITYMVFFQLIATYPLFLKEEYQLVEWQIGLLFALNTIVVVVCEMVLVDTLKGTSPIKLIAWGSFFMCEGFAILALGKGFGFALLSVLIYTIGEMLAMPQGLAYVSSFGRESNRAKYIGAFSTCISIAFVVGPLLGSWCYGWNHFLFWWMSLPIGLLVLFGQLWFPFQPNKPKTQANTRATHTINKSCDAPLDEPSNLRTLCDSQ